MVHSSFLKLLNKEPLIAGSSLDNDEGLRDLSDKGDEIVQASFCVIVVAENLVSLDRDGYVII